MIQFQWAKPGCDVRGDDGQRIGGPDHVHTHQDNNKQSQASDIWGEGDGQGSVPRLGLMTQTSNS